MSAVAPSFVTHCYPERPHPFLPQRPNTRRPRHSPAEEHATTRCPYVTARLSYLKAPIAAQTGAAATRPRACLSEPVNPAASGAAVPGYPADMIVIVAGVAGSGKTT